MQGEKHQGEQWPCRTPIMLENARVKGAWAVSFLKARTVFLWSWAWHWEQAPPSWAQVAVVSPCPMHTPPGAGVMTIVWVLGYHGCSVRAVAPDDLTWPSCFLRELMRSGEVPLSQRASLPLAGQRLEDRMEMGSTLCCSGTAPDPLRKSDSQKISSVWILESDGPPILPHLTPGALLLEGEFSVLDFVLRAAISPYSSLPSPWHTVDAP